MAHAARSPVSLILNTDGRRHTGVNTLAVVGLTLGLVAVLTTFWPGLHMVSSWAGLAGILVSGWGQYISVTTGERFLLVIGLGAAGLGFFLGVAHGGLIP